MKFYQKLTFIFLPFFFASCVSTLIKPDYVYGIRDTIEWGMLEDEILSWEGDTKSALVKSWGIPNNQMDLGNGEEQLEYFISSTDRTMTVYGSHDTTNTDAIIRFYLVNNEIKKISYNGEQHRLQEICKGYGKNWHSRSYSIYYDAEKRLKYKHPPTHEDFSTDELFTLLLPLSKYHDNKKYSRQLYQEAEDKYKKEGASKSEMELDIWRDQNTGAFFYRPLWNIESFLARVKVYREKFEGENFDWEPYFLDSINVMSKPSSSPERDTALIAVEKQKIKEQTEKQLEDLKQQALDDLEKEIQEKARHADKICRYTMDDFNSGRVRWQNVPLKDIQALKNYSTQSLIDFFNTYDYRKDIEDMLDSRGGKSEENIIYCINDFLSHGLNYATVIGWVAWVEYYYELYPNHIPK